MNLTPLERSHTHDEIERKLQNVFLTLFDQYIGPEVRAVQWMGAPAMGSLSLMQRHVTRAGLTVLQDTAEDSIRYLFEAWRYRNRRRSTQFLRAYLTVVFGTAFQIEWLYQRKDGTYPYNVATKGEIERLGYNLADYYRTRRLRVDIDVQYLPERIAVAARSVLPARTVLDMRTSSFVQLPTGMPAVGMGISIVRTRGSVRTY